jgi:hypothetical protein
MFEATDFNFISTVGAIIIFIEAIMIQLVLKLTIEDKLNFYIQYIAILGTIATNIGLLLIDQMQDKSKLYIVSLAVNTGYTTYCFLYFLMFFKQTKPLFGLYYKLFYKACLAVFLILLIPQFYTFFMSNYSLTNGAYYGKLTSIIDCTLVSLLMLVEFVINLLIAYKIRLTCKLYNNFEYYRLLLKMCSVLVLFFIADLTVVVMTQQNFGTIVYGIKAFTYALKIQTEYVCLSKIRYLYLTMQNYDNSRFRRRSSFLSMISI